MNGPSELRSPREAQSLYDALAALARRSPDGALASAALAGLLALLGLLFAPSDWRVFMLPVLALGAFGVWGMADRERESPGADADGAPRSGRDRALAAAQWLAAAVGTVAAAIATLALLGALFGTVIS